MGLREWRVRWHVEVNDQETLISALEAGADVFFCIDEPTKEPAKTAMKSIIPPVADANMGLPSHISEDLAQALFLLTGFRSEGDPAILHVGFHCVGTCKGCGAGSSGQAWACLGVP